MARVSLVLSLAVLAGTLAADPVFVAPYRDLGRPDPMNSRIIDREQQVPTVKPPGNAEDYVFILITGDPLIPKIMKPNQAGRTGPVSPRPGPGLLLTGAALEVQEETVRTLIAVRDYTAALAAAGRALDTARAAVQGIMPASLPPADLEAYIRRLTRWQQAAREGQLQVEAQREFAQKQVKLEGIIWDESDPVVILNGTSCSAGDMHLGVVVRAVHPRSVDIVLTFEGREFIFTLGMD